MYFYKSRSFVTYRINNNSIALFNNVFNYYDKKETVKFVTMISTIFTPLEIKHPPINILIVHY